MSRHSRKHKISPQQFAHCPTCSKLIVVNKKGLYTPHRAGQRMCIRSGARPRPDDFRR